MRRRRIPCPAFGIPKDAESKRRGDKIRLTSSYPQAKIDTIVSRDDDANIEWAHIRDPRPPAIKTLNVDGLKPSISKKLTPWQK